MRKRDVIFYFNFKRESLKEKSHSGKKKKRPFQLPRYQEFSLVSIYVSEFTMISDPENWPCLSFRYNQILDSLIHDNWTHWRVTSNLLWKSNFLIYTEVSTVKVCCHTLRPKHSFILYKSFIVKSCFVRMKSAQRLLSDKNGFWHQALVI